MVSISIAEASRLDYARRQILDNRYSVAAWMILLKDCQNRQIDECRDFYEDLVAQFPSSARFWKAYIDAELQQRNYPRVEKLFRRCLDDIPHLELWRLYINYVKEIYYKNTAEDKAVISKAYDVALKRVGMDVLSYGIWIEYINFLKSVDATGSYAENQKIATVRKIYQKAIQTPMINIEAMWKDYCSFETSVNATLAKKIIEDLSRDYLNIRRASKEFENLTRMLDRQMISVPPTRSNEEIKQVAAWKKYIAWEKSNPIRVEDETLVAQRVMFAYEQCLLCFNHRMDIWYEATEYLRNYSSISRDSKDPELCKILAEEASRLFEKAISTTMKDNMLIYFAFADYEETRQNLAKVETIYRRLLQNKEIDPTLCYMLYMRFAQRSLGIQAFRDIFKQARNDPRCKHHVYIAAALIEYFSSKDKELAKGVLSIGMKIYHRVPEYVMHTINFLKHLRGEEQAIRSTFDTSCRDLQHELLSSKTGTHENERLYDALKQIWYDYACFESSYGTLQKRQQVENRRSKALEKVSGLTGIDGMCALMVDRYRYMDLYPCGQNELKMFGYQDVSPASALPQSMKSDLNIASRDRGMFVTPDTKQMKSYRPGFEPAISLDPAQKCSFPFPPAAATLLRRIPPPTSFEGPFVLIEQFMDICKSMELPESFEPAFAEKFLNCKQIKPAVQEDLSAREDNSESEDDNDEK